MNLKKVFCGKSMERMPDIGFRMMSFMFRLKDIFFPIDKRIDTFGIRKGFTVIDYGCGPGRYLTKVSGLVGEKGKVYAADIHELAIKSVKKKMEKCSLRNIEPVLVEGYSCPIDDHTADIIYAVDMFHMIKEPEPFLKELHRLLKRDGFLIIDDGHQSRTEAKTKINNSKIWNITEETKDHLKCTPATSTVVV
jgi:ubiquinone/menaquinone biosynthesis C-methylase UbiE